MVLGLLTVSSVVGASSAAAQEGPETYEGPAFEDQFVLEGVGPGNCWPLQAVAGTTVDCRFPLIGRVQEPALWQGAVTVRQSTDWDGAEPRPCRFDDDELWCPNVGVNFEFGPVEVSLELEGQTRTLASYEVVEPWTFDYSMSLVGGEEPIAFEGRPLIVSSWRNDLESQESSYVMVRRRLNVSRDDPFETVMIEPLQTPEPGSYEGVETQIDIDLDPGRYAAVLCVGPSQAECSMVPGTYSFQVIDPTLHELVDQHNRPDAARINLVFVGSNLPAGVALPTIARQMLTIGGPAVVDFEGNVSEVSDTTSADEVAHIGFGPFAIEPLRSEVDRFNLWYLDGDLVDQRALFHNADPEFARDGELAGFDLPNTSIVTLHHSHGTFSRSEAWWTSFRGRTDVPQRDEMEFGGAYVSIDARNPLWSATTLAHELGHSLFDLRDEYTEFGRSTQFGYPNCAESAEQADEWWGPLEGQVDPFVHEYAQLLDRFDFWLPDTLIDDVTVGLIEGGCYGSGATAYRPTADSLMNNEIPVFGAVNRARVEALLDRFESRVDLARMEDLNLRCFPATRAEPGAAVRCSGELARFVDAAAGSIELSMAGQVVACSIDRVDDTGVRGVSCPELIATGFAPWTVVVSIDDGLGQVVARIEDATPEQSQPESPVADTTATSEIAAGEGEADNPVAGGGTYDGDVVLISGIFALVVIGIGGWLFSRSNKRARERSERERTQPSGDGEA